MAAAAATAAAVGFATEVIGPVMAVVECFNCLAAAAILSTPPPPPNGSGDGRFRLFVRSPLSSLSSLVVPFSPYACGD